MSILTLGPKGTFSDLASKVYNENQRQNKEIIFFSTFYEVITHLKNDDIAILPFENKIDGYIQSTLDLLYENNLQIIDTLTLDISYQLVSHVPLNAVTKTFVQFSTINQVSKFLHQNNLNHPVVTESNIESLELFLNNNQTCAVIPNHLNIDASYRYPAIENLKNNQTRFVIITKQQQETNHNMSRMSLFVLFKSDKSGMLYDLLHHFKNDSINILAILSRPSKKVLGSYYFFLEIDLTGLDLNSLDKKIATLKSIYDLKVAGLY